MGIEFGGRGREIRETEKDRSDGALEGVRRRPREGLGGGSLETGVGWNGDERLVEGIENRGYGGIEAAPRRDPGPLTRPSYKAVVLEGIGFNQATGYARQMWEAFERDLTHKPEIVIRLAEEIYERNGTITGFANCYLYSKTDNIQRNLDFYDEVSNALGTRTPTSQAVNEYASRAGDALHRPSPRAALGDW